MTRFVLDIIIAACIMVIVTVLVRMPVYRAIRIFAYVQGIGQMV